MKDVNTLMEKIHREAEEARTEVRFVRTCKPGDEIRQGDIYLYPIDAPSEHGTELETRQLAPGTTPRKPSHRGGQGGPLRAHRGDGSPGRSALPCPRARDRDAS